MPKNNETKNISQNEVINQTEVQAVASVIDTFLMSKNEHSKNYIFDVYDFAECVDLVYSDELDASEYIKETFIETLTANVGLKLNRIEISRQLQPIQLAPKVKEPELNNGLNTPPQPKYKEKEAQPINIPIGLESLPVDRQLVKTVDSPLPTKINTKDDSSISMKKAAGYIVGGAAGLWLASSVFNAARNPINSVPTVISNPNVEQVQPKTTPVQDSAGKTRNIEDRPAQAPKNGSSKNWRDQLK